jgi:hypothetical protein
MWEPVSLPWSRDARAADWLVERLTSGRSGYVEGVVPAGFEAYARILHPAWVDFPDGDAVRWGTVASTTGRVLHPSAQFAALARPVRYASPWDGGPPAASLSLEQVEILTGLLGGAGAGRWYFCLWDGYGWLYSSEERRTRFPWDRLKRIRVLPEFPPDLPRIRTSGFEYLLYEGNAETTARLCRWPWYQSPNIWWPEGREWCVATSVDLQSTYIGGAGDLVLALLSDARLEAFAVQLNDPVALDSDVINT